MNTLSVETEICIYSGIDYWFGSDIVTRNEWPEYVKIMNDIKFLIGSYP